MGSVTSNVETHKFTRAAKIGLDGAELSAGVPVV